MGTHVSTHQRGYDWCMQVYAVFENAKKDTQNPRIFLSRPTTAGAPPSTSGQRQSPLPNAESGFPCEFFQSTFRRKSSWPGLTLLPRTRSSCKGLKPKFGRKQAGIVHLVDLQIRQSHIWGECSFSKKASK